MKQQHPIDDLFRAQLKDHSVEPPMDLWGNIDKERNRKKALLLKRGQKKYWALLGMLLITGMSIWMYSPVNHEAFLLLESNTTSATKALFIKEKIAIETNLATPKTSSNKLNNTLKTLEGKIKNVLKVTTKKEKIKLLNTPIIDAKEMANIAISNKNEILLKVSEKLILPSTTTSLATAGVITKNISSTTTVENTIEKQGFIKPENAINLIPKNALKLLSFDVSGSLNLIPKETDCPTFNGLPRGLYLDVNASIDVAQRTMKSRLLEMDDYLSKRKQTELPYFAFSTSVHVTALSNRGFAITAGVDYTQINEYFSYENGYEEKISITNIYENDEIIGHDTIVNIGIRRITAINRYKMIDIPLLLGYEFDFSNFSLNLYGGPILNLVFNKKGSFLSPVDVKPTGTVEDKPRDFEVAFQDNLGLGWYASMGFAYKLRKGTQIRFEPYFRVYPKSFTKESFPIEQKYFLTGIKIGVRQRL